MHVTNSIQPIEINGQESFGVKEQRRLLVESHHAYTDRVHLRFGELNLLVLSGDLERAIRNACNYSR